MKKKNVATIMASTMAMASVMPVFAAEETVTTITIDVRTANGEKMSVENGNVVKTKIEGDSVILAKHAMDTKIAEIEKMSKETYEAIEDGKVVVKNKYDVKIDEEASVYKYSVDSQGNFVDNKVVVVVKNNQTEEVTNYEFVGIKEYDLDHGFGQELKVKNVTMNLANKNHYAKMTKVQYELEKNADKLIVKKEKETHESGMGYDLKLVVTLNDGTTIANITIKNVQALNKDEYVSLPVNGDITGHWAEETVLTAMFDKWVDASTSFRPEDSITRAEFVKIVNRAFGIDTSAVDASLTTEFEDVECGQWYYADVKAAALAGYINGYEDGTFRPDQPITRQEAAKIIAKLHNGADVEEVAEDINGVEVQLDTKTKFKDDLDIAVWADESVEYLTDENIIKGYDGNLFMPQNNIKRAEAVEMMARAVKNN